MAKSKNEEDKKETKSTKNAKTKKVEKTAKTAKTEKTPKTEKVKKEEKPKTTSKAKITSKASEKKETKSKKVEEPKKETIIEVENYDSGIEISNDVIAVIAGVAVSEVQGVASMSGGFAGGISEVLSGKKNLAKGIKVEKDESTAKIDVNIIVEYGTRIPDVAFEVQNRVKKAVESMTGFTVEEVNVHIQGVNTKITRNAENQEESEKE